MKSFLLVAMLAPTVALAGAFDEADVPATMTFNYDWTPSAASVGSTNFTFDNPTATNENRYLCRTLDTCFTGDFVTGNDGVGTFEVNMGLANCVDGPTSQYLFTSMTQTERTCDLVQTLTLEYDVTGAQYSGSATYGSIFYLDIRRFGRSRGALVSSITITRASPDGPFSGTTSLAAFSGTFNE